MYYYPVDENHPNTIDFDGFDHEILSKPPKTSQIDRFEWSGARQGSFCELGTTQELQIGDLGPLGGLPNCTEITVFNNSPIRDTWAPRPPRWFSPYGPNGRFWP